MIKIDFELIMFKIMDKIVNITASTGEKIKYGNINIGINRSYWNCSYKILELSIMKIYKKARKF